MSIHYLTNKPTTARGVAAYEAAMKTYQSLEDFMQIWDFSCDDKWNSRACKEYNIIFIQKAMETRSDESTRMKRSYFDPRARYLHLATLDELMDKGYSGYIGSTGKIFISRLNSMRRPWWETNEFLIKID